MSDEMEMCECVDAEMPEDIRPGQVVLSEHDSWFGRLVKVARRDCERCHGSGLATPVMDEVDRLRSVNAELLAACEAAKEWIPTFNVHTAHQVLIQLRDAIARATEQTPV